MVAQSSKSASSKLLEAGQNHVKSKVFTVEPGELAFLFPGQGSQYLQMGKALYEQENVFKTSVDTCAELLRSELKLDIRDIIYPKENTTEAYWFTPAASQQHFRHCAWHGCQGSLHFR